MARGPKSPQVPLELWSELYQAAIAFNDCGPWTILEPDAVVAVINPENQEPGYCCVMGHMGQIFGMEVYLGGLGHNTLSEIMNAVGQPPMDIAYRKNSLYLEFVGSDEPTKEEKSIIRKLGLKFRGPAAWPLFRSCRPDCVPWFLEEPEVRFFAIALRQIVAVCERVLAESTLVLPPTRHDGYLTRVPESRDGRVVWSDRWVKPKPFEKPPLPVMVFDEVRFAQAKKKVKHIDKSWAVGLLSAMPVEDDERPYYTRLFLAADEKSGYLFASAIMHPKSYHELLLPKLIEVIEKTGIMPSTIRISSPDLHALLKAPLKRMGIEVKLVKNLPVIEEAYESMLEYFGNQ